MSSCCVCIVESRKKNTQPVDNGTRCIGKKTSLCPSATAIQEEKKAAVHAVIEDVETSNKEEDLKTLNVQELQKKAATHSIAIFAAMLLDH